MLVFPVYPRWLTVQRIDEISTEMQASTRQQDVSEMLIKILYQSQEVLTDHSTKRYYINDSFRHRDYKLSSKGTNVTVMGCLIGRLRKSRRRPRREYHPTKGSMSKTITAHVRYKSLFIS